jgi:hypothetical protein
VHRDACGLSCALLAEVNEPANLSYNFLDLHVQKNALLVDKKERE